MNKDPKTGDEVQTIDVEQYVIDMLARGEAVARTAAQSGLSERTIYRWKNNPEFMAKVAEHRAWLFSSAAGSLLYALSKASETLVNLTRHGDPHVRYKAAMKLIELAFKVREMDEEDRRLEKLKIIVTVPEQAKPAEHVLPENTPQLEEAAKPPPDAGDKTFESGEV